jgi:hypothetical protein
MYAPSPSASVPALPKKSKMGLVIALIAFLAVAGGVTAFVLLNQEEKKNDIADKDKDKDKGSDHAGSARIEGGSGSSGSATRVVVNDGSGDRAGSASVPPVTHDGSAAGGKGSQDAPPPATKEIEELIMTKPLVDFEIWEDGKKVMKGPGNFKLEAGSEHHVVLKAHGYKDAKVVVDGKKDQLIVKRQQRPADRQARPRRRRRPSAAAATAAPAAARRRLLEVHRRPQGPPLRAAVLQSS